MKSISLIDRLAIAVSVLIFIAAAWIALKGPTTPIPLHFNIQGEADRFGSRYELAMIFAGLGVLNLIVAFMTGKHASQTQDPVRQKALRRGQLMSVLMMGGTAGLIGWSGLGPQATTGTHNLTMTSVFISAICLVIGAVIGKVGPNPFIGVKTPWAYKSRLAWDKSNRLAGRLLFWIGLAGLVASPVAPQPVTSVLIIVAILVAALWSVYESWRVWRADPEAQAF